MTAPTITNEVYLAKWRAIDLTPSPVALDALNRFSDRILSMADADLRTQLGFNDTHLIADLRDVCTGGWS